MHNTLRAYFYLLEGEPMPENAPDEWFLPRETSEARTPEQIEAFATQAQGLIEDLRILTTEDDYQTAFYNRAKMAFGEDRASIKIFFQMLYLLLFQRNHGPRWGQFVQMIGRDRFIENLQERLSNPLN